MKPLIFVFLNLLCYTSSYRFLVIYPLPFTSISILGRSVVETLLKDGHEVTYITAHPLNKPQNKNFRQIDVSQNSKLFEVDPTWTINNIRNNNLHRDIRGVQTTCYENARLTFQNENVTKFLENTNEHFDAVIADLMETEIYAGLSVLYNSPMVWVFSMGAHWQVLQLIADTSNPAYDTDYYGVAIPPLTFMERVEELFSRAKWIFYKRFYALPVERDIYEQTFGPLLTKRGRKLPDYYEIMYNSSMIFGNEHNAVVFRPSTPQNFKYIGGIHINDPVKPLPKDLQDAMDNAPHGVIYFSMGSFLKSKQLPTKIIRDILAVFGELKEKVIWKFEDNLKDLPKNVFIVPWAPQQSILAHPNIKIFISHGGLFSSIESVHFGVPVIGVPIILDQRTNVIKAVANGYAIKVELDDNFTTNLKTAINTMLTDDTYRKKIKEFSMIYHDRPMKPGDDLAFWVRHVVKTGGARHLRSPAVNVPLYQRLYLDLVAIVIGIIVAIYLYLNKESKKIVKKSARRA